MRILIVSDTHRKHENLDTVLSREGKIDMLIHAGDSEDEHYVERAVDCPVHMVAGNCDLFSFLPKEKEFSVGDYNVLLTHGHHYYADRGTMYLKQAARQRKANMVIFGHTHVPLIDTDDDIIAINPGSLSKPRQYGWEPTYVMMEIDKAGQISFELRYLKK